MKTHIQLININKKDTQAKKYMYIFKYAKIFTQTEKHTDMSAYIQKYIYGVTQIELQEEIHLNSSPKRCIYKDTYTKKNTNTHTQKSSEEQ